jgi:hypothetical protein
MKFWPSSEEAARNAIGSLDGLPEHLRNAFFPRGRIRCICISNGSSREQIGYVCFVPTGAMTFISATTSSSLT